MTDSIAHVLVVDDDNLLRRSLVDKLTDAGFRTAEAADGKTGLKIALETRPQVILLDQQMPDQTGIETLIQLRQNDDWGKNVEVIFATNLYEPRVINDAIEHGVHDYILKADVTLEQIVELVKKYIPLPSN